MLWRSILSITLIIPAMVTVNAQGVDRQSAEQLDASVRRALGPLIVGRSRQVDCEVG